MNCPACKDTVLLLADRQGVEIDYCPKCRGVWLDRGELDKIIERSENSGQSTGQVAGGGQVTQQPSRPPAPSHQQMPPPAHGGPRRLDDSDYHTYENIDRSGRPYRKRKSLLRELFDFD